MAEIINLRKARKAKARAEDERKAADNRLAFGRSRAEKQQGAAERALETRRLDAHRLEKAEEPQKPEGPQ